MNNSFSKRLDKLGRSAPSGRVRFIVIGLHDSEAGCVNDLITGENHEYGSDEELETLLLSLEAKLGMKIIEPNG